MASYTYRHEIVSDKNQFQLNLNQRSESRRLDLALSLGTCLENGLSRPLVNSYLEGYEAIRQSIKVTRIKTPLMEDSCRDLLVRAMNYHQMKQ